MEWTQAIADALAYIDAHLSDELTADIVARQVHVSSFYFQRGFALLCGCTIMEYIRSCRLALAGSELVTTDARVIDLALKYGYDSPDSFSRAFTRFHGVTPTMARRTGAPLRAFVPLRLKFSLEGGCQMEYKIVKKDSFTVMGVKKQFAYEHATQEVPAFWQQHFASGGARTVCGMFGVNMDEQMGGDTFTYLIADSYDPAKSVPEGCVTQVIPAFTWAVFPCRGPITLSMSNVNERIFSEWLPALREYEFAAGYCIEWYTDAADYPKGTQDDAYYAEIWIPIKKK